MYGYSRRPEAEANIGAVEAVVVTTDVGSFFSGILSSTESSKPRFTDWTEGQIGELTDDDISGLDETSSPDLNLLKDIFLLDPDNRKRLSNRQRLAVERSLNVKEDSGTDYEKKQAIEQTAQAILDTRAIHSDRSIAELYKLDKMPSDLLAAHKALDKAVEQAYDVNFNGDEKELTNYLIALYANSTKD